MSQRKYLGNPGPEDIAEASAIQSRSGWTHAIGIPCEIRGAPAAAPCWSWPGDTYDHSGLCDRRCREAGLVPPAPRGGGRTPSASAGASADLGRRQVAARHPNR